MLRERSEVIAFSRDDLERIVRYITKERITSSLFLGKFGEQTIRWTSDGGVEVTTTYAEGDLTDLPEPMAIAVVTESKKKKK